MNPNVQVICADPEGSILSGDSPKPWKVEGIGEDFVPKTLNSQLVDEWIRIGDTEAFHIARQVARREGMLFGGSSGTAIAAALRYARRLTSEHLVVALCADTGRNYMTKMFDDDWLAANKLTMAVDIPHSVGDLLKSRGQRKLVFISPKATVSDAIGLLQTTGISQLPVIDDEHFVIQVRRGSLFGALPVWVPVGDRVGQGRRCGLRRFAREIDLYLPAGARVEVPLGSRVRCGQTLIATIVRRKT